jgi:hypothetical protein
MLCPMSDIDHKELDEDAPEFEERGLKPEEQADEPDPAEPWTKTSSGDPDDI